MGSCCFKANVMEYNDEYVTWPEPGAISVNMDVPTVREQRDLDPTDVDDLVWEILGLISRFYDSDEESPPPLIKIHNIADKEQGWIQVVMSMIKVIPLDNPLGPSTITIIFDDCPLPSKHSVLKLCKLLNLSKQRALENNINVALERNICIILGCMAEKLAAPNSIAVLTEETLDYLIAFLEARTEPNVVLFALIALEKFAHTKENKLTIEKRLTSLTVNPLVQLEMFATSNNYYWRQIGFCAKWNLDNIFIVAGRSLSYQTVDMSRINVILNTKDVSEYLKISHDGLEARCDTYSFESVRSTFQVDYSCWYYECTVVTPGIMQIGWATKSSRFLNHEGYGVGDDFFSLSYDGCRQLIWYRARPTVVLEVPKWRPGDVLGCLIDLEKQEAIFSLNGIRMPRFTTIFQIVKRGFFAAASFMAFQQCRFNFGNEPFQFPPTDRHFKTFHYYGYLTEEQKRIVPRRMYLETMSCPSDTEDSCTLCYNGPGTCVLEPCQHKGFCSRCITLLKKCPMCRRDVKSSRQENNTLPINKDSSPVNSDTVNN